MENKGIPPEDWLEMTEDADQLLLQEKLDEIAAETEEYRFMVELLKSMGASRRSIKSYEDAVQANEWRMTRIHEYQEKFEEEIKKLESEA